MKIYESHIRGVRSISDLVVLICSYVKILKCVRVLSKIRTFDDIMSMAISRKRYGII